MKYSGILLIGFKLLVNDRGQVLRVADRDHFCGVPDDGLTAMLAGILNRAFSPVTNIGAAMWILNPAVNTAASPILPPNLGQSDRLEPRILLNGAQGSTPNFYRS